MQLLYFMNRSCFATNQSINWSMLIVSYFAIKEGLKFNKYMFIS